MCPERSLELPNFGLVGNRALPKRCQQRSATHSHPCEVVSARSLTGPFADVGPRAASGEWSSAFVPVIRRLTRRADCVATVAGALYSGSCVPTHNRLQTRWPRAVAHPQLPQSRTCGTPASGSSADGFATSDTHCVPRAVGVKDDSPVSDGIAPSSCVHGANVGRATCATRVPPQDESVITPGHCP